MRKARASQSGARAREKRELVGEGLEELEDSSRIE
ncbi:hypothetical protein A2U01_0069224, partial [Trifolium medium]|nr:hypothetical protein [Trifolium medium]